MQTVVVIADSFECGPYHIHWICWHSHITFAMILKLYSIPFSDRILSLNDTTTLSSHSHSFSFSLSIFSRLCKTVRPKSPSVDGWYPATRVEVRVGKVLPTQAPTPTPTKTVDSYRLQLRCRLRLRSPGWWRLLLLFQVVMNVWTIMLCIIVPKHHNFSVKSEILQFVSSEGEGSVT